MAQSVSDSKIMAFPFPWADSEFYYAFLHMGKYTQDYILREEFYCLILLCMVIRSYHRSENFGQKLRPSDQRSENVCKN